MAEKAYEKDEVPIGAVIVDKDGNVVDIKIQDEIIMLNKTYMSNCIFIFAVAVLCHEMIHYYDRFTKEFHNKQLKAFQLSYEFASDF